MTLSLWGATNVATLVRNNLRNTALKEPSKRRHFLPSSQLMLRCIFQHSPPDEREKTTSWSFWPSSCQNTLLDHSCRWTSAPFSRVHCRKGTWTQPTRSRLSIPVVLSFHGDRVWHTFLLPLLSCTFQLVRTDPSVEWLHSLTRLSPTSGPHGAVPQRVGWETGKVSKHYV